MTQESCAPAVPSTEAVLGCEVRAPSTLGTFMRSFRWGHALQHDVVSREALERAWKAGAGWQEGTLTIDLDSTICETYGTKKASGSRFTYTHMRGHHPLLAGPSCLRPARSYMPNSAAASLTPPTGSSASLPRRMPACAGQGSSPLRNGSREGVSLHTFATRATTSHPITLPALL